MELSIYIQEGLSQELMLTRRVHRMGYAGWKVALAGESPLVPCTAVTHNKHYDINPSTTRPTLLKSSTRPLELVGIVTKLCKRGLGIALETQLAKMKSKQQKYDIPPHVSLQIWIP